MYDINTKNVKKGFTFYFIFLIVGLLMLIIFSFLLICNYVRLNKYDEKTISTRVVVDSYIDSDESIQYSPTYYYRVDGREYLCSSDSSSNIRPSNSNKFVYYDSKNPSNCITEYSKSDNNTLLLCMILPLIFIVIAVINIRKICRRLKLINELNKKGKLVKNLYYHLENTGLSVNDVEIQRPVVDYTLPTGRVVQLYGDPRHDRKAYDADGMVDLVIDENNPDHYFIDFEINRLTGNLKTDYYDYQTGKFQEKQLGGETSNQQNLSDLNSNNDNNNQEK